jgi:hypothetical protein
LCGYPRAYTSQDVFPSTAFFKQKSKRLFGMPNGGEGVACHQGQYGLIDWKSGFHFPD